MPGEEYNTVIGFPVGDRNACIAQASDTRRYSGNNPVGYIFLHEHLTFLAATTENKRIPALKPQNAFTRECEFNKLQRNISLFG